jgi:hypothetical protein
MKVRDYILLYAIGTQLAMNTVLLYCFIMIWDKGSITLVESSFGIRFIETVALMLSLGLGIVTAVRRAIKIGKETN